MTSDCRAATLWCLGEGVGWLSASGRGLRVYVYCIVVCGGDGAVLEGT